MINARSKIAAGCMLLLVLLGNAALPAWNWARPLLPRDPLAGLPRVFLWAWERPENLEYVNPREVGVALLAKTLDLRGSHIRVRPRMQPVKLPAGAITIAVVRIETGKKIPSETVRQAAAREILALASRSAAGVQIDFDARASERPFYRTLLSEIRRGMPAGKKLSMTALASWCIYDDWITDLPVDEAVPMMFRLGTGESEVKAFLADSRDFRPAKARFSIGVTLDEPPLKARGRRRVYIFNPRSWTPKSVDAALGYAKEWR